MTLRHLKIFVAVYETLSFTKAGKRLFLAQPAISLAIKELEEHYAVPLFDRIKHSIHPTSYGEDFYKYASQILSLMGEMEDFTKNWNTNTTLRIGSSITIGNNILPTLVKTFAQLYPQTEVEVMINNTSVIESAILQNKIDFALIENEPTLEKIAKIPFMQDSLCTLASKEHPLAKQKKITLQQLSNEHFLMREKGSSVRKLVDSIFTANQLSVKPYWESISTQALIKAVENNLGITTLPYQLIKQRYDNDKVVILNSPELNIQRSYNIIYYEDKFLSKTAKAFFEICKKEKTLSTK